MIRHILKLIWNKKRSNTLLFLEIFFAFAILFAVFTIVTRYMRQYNSPLGFDTEHIWVVHMNFDNITDTAAVEDMKLRLKSELEAMPQIEGAAYNGWISPFSGSNWVTASDANGFDTETSILMAEPAYFELMGLELVQGRWFDLSDLEGRYTPAVISQQFYEESFKGRNLRDSIYELQGENRIVGVFKNYKYQGDFTKEENATFFMRHPKDIDLPNLHLRIAPGTPAAFEETVNKTVASISRMSDFTIEHLETTRKVQNREVWVPVVSLLGIAIFLVINVAMGLFGVLWYSISKRKAEVGLRQALGASRGAVMGQFMGEILAVSVAALLLGAVFAIQLPLMEVFGIAPLNYYIAMGLSAGLILTLVLLCTLYPALQAARIQPALALHEE